MDHAASDLVSLVAHCDFLPVLISHDEESVDGALLLDDGNLLRGAVWSNERDSGGGERVADDEAAGSKVRAKG